MKKVVPLYVGRAEAFYAVITAILRSCNIYVDVFSAFKPMYTPQWIKGVQDAADAAQLIPDNHNRQGVSRMLYAALTRANDACCANASYLFNYIGTAFEPSVVEAMRKQAGAEAYKSAMQDKWNFTTPMNLAMARFIDTYSSELTAAGMPEDFPATCEAAGTAFDTALEAYRANQASAKGQTADKVAANNEVYTSIVQIMTDGKLLFANDETKRKQFVYNEVLNTVRRPGKTGFRIAVSNKATKQPIANAHVSFTNSSATGITDKKGIANIEMPEGTYSYLIAAAGFTTMVGTLTTKKNTMKHPKIQMTAVTTYETVAPELPHHTKEKAAL